MITIIIWIRDEVEKYFKFKPKIRINKFLVLELLLMLKRKGLAIDAAVCINSSRMSRQEGNGAVPEENIHSFHQSYYD